MSFDVQMIREHKKDYPEILKAVTYPFLERAAVIVEETAKRLCPYITGNLKGSINREVSPTEAVVGTNVDYAEWVEYKTRPHIIPGPAKIPGVGWRRNINHPGTAEQPFMRPAIDQNRKKLTQLLGEMIIAKMVRG